MDGSVILEEEIDSNYEPTPKEIEEYANWLGMELPKDKDLLYIAREGLMAPLPPEWKPCKNKNGEIYYFNFNSSESVWTHPCDEYYKRMVREAKAAKVKRKDSQPRKSSKSPNPVDVFEKMQSVPKKQAILKNEVVASSEFVNRKNRLEQSYNEEIEKIRHEYENKRKLLKTQIDLELENEKKGILTLHKDKEERAQEEHRQKMEKQQESLNQLVRKNEQERENLIQREVTEKIEEIKKEFARDLEEGKKKQADIYKRELEAELKRLSILKEEELKQLQEEIDLYKERVQWELKEQEETKQRFQKKIDRIKTDSEIEYQSEVKKLDKELEWQLYLAKEDQVKELSEDEIYRLNVVENELKTNIALEIAKYKSELQNRLASEKEKVDEAARQKRQRERLLRENQFDRELSIEEEKHKQILKDKLTKHRFAKELYISEQLTELKSHLQTLLESEEKKLEYNRKPDLYIQDKLEERLNTLQRDHETAQRKLASKEETYRSLQDDLNKIKQDLQTKIPEKSRIEAQALTDNGLIAEFNRQLKEKEREIERFAEINPRRIESLEHEVVELKRIISSKQRVEEQERYQRQEQERNGRQRRDEQERYERQKSEEQMRFDRQRNDNHDRLQRNESQEVINK